MNTLSTIATSRGGWDSEDALKVLGRVADAFDSPSLHTTDKELKLFVVNVVKSRHLSTSFASGGSVWRGTRHGPYEPSFDVAYDEDVERHVQADVCERATPYLHAPRRRLSRKQRQYSTKVFEQACLHSLECGTRDVCGQDDGMYDVTKMLLTSSPLDRLDRLARMELKKTGWVERADKWTIVEMGLQGAPPPVTPPKRVSKKIDTKSESGGYCPLTKTTSPGGRKQARRTPRRPGTGGQPPSGGECGDNTAECHQRQGDAIKRTPPRMRSPAWAQASRPHLTDVFALAHANAPKFSRTDSTTTIGASRLSRALLQPQGCREQTRGRLGQVVRNIVKRMLPPPSVGRNSSSYSRTRCTGEVKAGALATRASEAEMTPRSDASAWSFASVSSWRGCVDYQTANRWSGFWH